MFPRRFFHVLNVKNNNLKHDVALSPEVLVADVLQPKHRQLQKIKTLNYTHFRPFLISLHRLNSETVKDSNKPGPKVILINLVLALFVGGLVAVILCKFVLWRFFTP